MLSPREDRKPSLYQRIFESIRRLPCTYTKNNFDCSAQSPQAIEQATNQDGVPEVVKDSIALDDTQAPSNISHSARTALQPSSAAVISSPAARTEPPVPSLSQASQIVEQTNNQTQALAVITTATPVIQNGIHVPSNFTDSVKKSMEIALDGFKLLSHLSAQFLDGTPFQVPLEVLNTILDTAEAVADNNSAMHEALDQIGDRLKIINRTLRSPQPSPIQNICQEFVNRLNGTFKEIERMANHGLLRRIAQSEEDPKELENLLNNVNEATKDFELNLTLETGKVVHDIESRLQSQHLDKWLLLPKDYVLPNVVCTQNTRGYVLQRIREWATNSSIDSPHIFWLAGRAGTGKSTIACTINNAEDRQNQGLVLGSSFFCSRQFPETRQRRSVIPTIASQLARASPSYGKALLEKDSNERLGLLLFKPNEHFKKFIVEPWAKVDHSENHSPIIIIIDALDELDAEDGKSAGAKLIQELIENARNLRGLKFLVTSRPEPALVSHCEGLEAFYHLEDADAMEVKQDLEMYVREALPDLRELQSDGQNLLTHLVDLSDGLFIFAATVVRFVNMANAKLQRVAQLERIVVDWPKHEELGGKALALDNIYTEILKNAFPELYTLKRPMLSVLSTILCAQEPLAASTISELLQSQDRGIDEGVVKDTIRRLYAVLREDHTSGRIYTYHKSFYDFMLDPSRCGVDFVCKPAEQHFVLAKSCFNVMSSELKFNICDLPSSFLFDKEVPDLKLRVKERISSALQYASRCWAYHFPKSWAGPEDPKSGEASMSSHGHELLGYLRTFCTAYLLFWIETMNLIGLCGECVELLSDVQNLLPSISDEALLKELHIAENLARSFASNPVSKSTPHLYISILPSYTSSQTLRVLKTLQPRFRQMPVMHGLQGANRLLSTINVGSPVNSVSISPNGRHFVSGSWDSTIRVWDASTGDEQLKLEGHFNDVNAVSFSPDGKRIVSGSDDKTVRVWDAWTGDEQLKLEGHFNDVNAVSFSPDGKRIVSGSDDKTVRVWDAWTGDEQMVLGGHTSWVNSVSFSPEGKRIVSGSGDSTIHVWDASTGDEQLKLEGHFNDVNAVSFSPDGKRIVSGSDDKTVRVWDAWTGDEQLKLEGHFNDVNAVSFSPDGQRIVSGSRDNTVRVWDASTGYKQPELRGHTSWVNSVSFSPDGERIVSGSYDKTVRMWDASTGDEQMVLGGHTSWVNSVSFSPEGKRIVSGSGDSTIRVWDASTGDEQMVLGGHTSWVNSVSFSPDGERIVSGSDDKTVRVWDAWTGDEQLKLEGHFNDVNAVSFSPDGKRIVSGSRDNTVRVWDASTGYKQPELRGHTSWVNSVSFSPDGKRIVSGSRDNTVRVWDASTGDEQLKLDGHTKYARAVSFSPDGERIVSGSYDKTVRVWDASTGYKQPELRGHTSWVNSVSFSPDGKRIVSGSGDSAIRVWDVLQEVETDEFRRVSDDGWIMSSKGEKLMWVSSNNASILRLSPCQLIISTRGSLSIDLKKEWLGERWADCYSED